MFYRNYPNQFVKVISQKRNLIRRLDTLMLTFAISVPIPFSAKGKGYYRSLILDVIDLLVIQCQRRLSTNDLIFLGVSWNWLTSPIWHIICWIYMSKNWWKLNILLFWCFTIVAQPLTSEIPHVSHHVVIKWWNF